MPDEKMSRLLSRFAAAAKAHYAALESMNETRANFQAKVIAGLVANIFREGAAGRESLLSLVDSDNPAVAGMAAVYSLTYDAQRSLTLLRRLAEEPGLLGFRAGTAIQRWESGEWEK
jgi:hypothetical protein